MASKPLLQSMQWRVLFQVCKANVTCFSWVVFFWMYRSLYTGSTPTQMPPRAYAEWKGCLSGSFPDWVPTRVPRQGSLLHSQCTLEIVENLPTRLCLRTTYLHCRRACLRTPTRTAKTVADFMLGSAISCGRPFSTFPCMLRGKIEDIHSVCWALKNQFPLQSSLWYSNRSAYSQFLLAPFWYHHTYTFWKKICLHHNPSICAFPAWPRQAKLGQVRRPSNLKFPIRRQRRGTTSGTG